MERIVVIGCPGSGKSTLSLALKERLGLPVIHLDQLWWRENWTNGTKEEFDQRLELVLEMDRWIMDGNFNRTIPQRLRRCDTVIYLDFNRLSCLWGAFCRIVKNYGKVRPDMAKGCPERFDWDFVKYIWTFNENNRVRNYTYLAQASHAEKIVLKNRKEVNAFLDTL